MLELPPSPSTASLQGRQAQPSLRYLTLIRDGAVEHGLTPEYRRWLGTLQHYEATTVGQRAGRLMFTGLAFVLIFPVWAGADVDADVWCVDVGALSTCCNLLCE